MPWNARDPFAPHLRPDEQILWRGRPSGNVYVSRNWMYSVFGLFWMGLFALWFLSVRTAGLPPAFYLVAIPLAVVTGWMTFGHLFWAAIELHNVYYAITDWRVLMSYGWPRVKIRSVPLARIAELDLWPRRHGYGDIRLGLEVGFWDGARWAKAGAITWGHHDLVLRGIPACADVYGCLCEAIRAPAGHRPA